MLEDAGVFQIDLARLISMNQEDFFSNDVMNFKCILPTHKYEDDDPSI